MIKKQSCVLLVDAEADASYNEMTIDAGFVCGLLTLCDR